MEAVAVVTVLKIEVGFQLIGGYHEPNLNLNDNSKCSVSMQCSVSSPITPAFFPPCNFLIDLFSAFLHVVQL